MDESPIRDFLPVFAQWLQTLFSLHAEGIVDVVPRRPSVYAFFPEINRQIGL
ncbi:hypothetical protein HMPREF1861_01745 [Corynebacterium kroppenstedtii]|nr:hypothetical protein HMPREF1861_01745 [Corynebacterium kroppenstedtii]